VSERPSVNLLFDESMRLMGWTNIETGEVKSPYPNLNPQDCKKLAFSGIHLGSKKVFKAMEAWPDKFSITDF
jgi:MurNAc alpha-1-phosphate uridylyltransferase